MCCVPNVSTVRVTSSAVPSFASCTGVVASIGIADFTDSFEIVLRLLALVLSF